VKLYLLFCPLRRNCRFPFSAISPFSPFHFHFHFRLSNDFEFYFVCFATIFYSLFSKCLNAAAALTVHCTFCHAFFLCFFFSRSLSSHFREPFHSPKCSEQFSTNSPVISLNDSFLSVRFVYPTFVFVSTDTKQVV
jgi:hypothetical protein